MKVVLSIPQKKVTHQSSILTSKALSSQWLLFPYPSLTFRPNPSHRRCLFVSLRLLAPPSTLHLYFSGKKKKTKLRQSHGPSQSIEALSLFRQSPYSPLTVALAVFSRCLHRANLCFLPFCFNFHLFFFHPSLLHLLSHVYNPRPSRPLFH